MSASERIVKVSIGEQRLRLEEAGRALLDVAVSTAANGPGERLHSECTPRGWHTVRAKIGAGAPPDTVFIARRRSGEIFEPSMRERYPGRDWVLTRVLWLSGLEPGRNRLGDVDSMRRYIYIHGAPDDVSMGKPGSRGCVRMRNADVIRLFDEIEVGTRVLIED